MKAFAMLALGLVLPVSTSITDPSKIVQPGAVPSPSMTMTPPVIDEKHIVDLTGKMPIPVADNLENAMRTFEHIRSVDIRVFMLDGLSMDMTGLGPYACQLLDANRVGSATRDGGVVLLVVPRRGVAVCPTYYLRPVFEEGEMNRSVRALNQALAWKGQPVDVTITGINVILHILANEHATFHATKA